MALAENLASIRQRIDAACERAGRDPSTVTLLAVSKGMPPEVVLEAAGAGLGVFGENKVQEARAKIPLCPGRLRWHMIGHLQSNKCRDAVRLFEMIHSVDSLALAEEINKWADQQAKTMPLLLEVNLAGESTKFGFKPDQVAANLAAINDFPKLEIHGLMTMAFWIQDPEKVRTIFR
jgi:PLP dependent protein